MKQSRYFLNFQLSLHHHSRYLFNSFFFLLTILFKKPFMFWLPLIASTALALTTVSLPYHTIVMNDKLLHVFTFSYLTFSWIWINRSHKSPYRIIIILFLYGLLIEWMQSFLPSRTCSLADVAANGTGCILGFSATRFLNYIKKRFIIIVSPSSGQKETANASDKNHTAIT